jgi:hypothetical protein
VLAVSVHGEELILCHVDYRNTWNLYVIYWGSNFWVFVPRIECSLLTIAFNILLSREFPSEFLWPSGYIYCRWIEWRKIFHFLLFIFPSLRTRGKLQSKAGRSELPGGHLAGCSECAATIPVLICRCALSLLILRRYWKLFWLKFPRNQFQQSYRFYGHEML